jgi:hypothetical protein
MAGGQERVLRRRIRSVQSTRKITKAMELIAASQIVRAQNRIAGQPALPEGMERVLRRGGGRPGSPPRSCSARPSRPSGSASWPSWATAAWPAPTTRASCAPTERLVAEHGPQRRRGDGCGPWARRPRPTSATAASRWSVVHRGGRPPRVRRRPRRRRRRHRPVRGRRDRPGADGLDPLHLGRDPAGRDHADAAPPPARRGEAGGGRRLPEDGASATPSSSPSPRSCWPKLAPRALPRSEIFAALLEGAASFFTASSGPWRRPPRTPTSSSAP